MYRLTVYKQPPCVRNFPLGRCEGVQICKAENSKFEMHRCPADLATTRLCLGCDWDRNSARMLVLIDGRF